MLYILLWQLRYRGYWGDASKNGGPNGLCSNKKSAYRNNGINGRNLPRKRRLAANWLFNDSTYREREPYAPYDGRGVTWRLIQYA